MAAAALGGACAGADRSGDPAPARVEVAVDGGDDLLVGTAPVRAVVPAGATLAVANVSTGASATHVFTSAPPGEGAPLFSRAGSGALPNPGVWGQCLGGRISVSARTCPVLPVEGPTTWDGDAYASLGSVLPGDARELRLSPGLRDGRELRLWCSVHPELSVTVEVGDPASAPPAPPPPPAGPAPARPGEVVVAPQAPGVERLEYLPAERTVPVGGTVTWRVPGVAPHTVEFAAEPPALEDTTPAEAAPDAPAAGWDGRGTVRSGFLSADAGAPGGSVFRLRFLVAGRYLYACRFHPQMRGTVIVRPV